MRVALTIPILHIRNLCSPDHEVSSNFVPQASGGVPPWDLSAKLYPEALKICGYSAAVSRLIFDHLIRC